MNELLELIVLNEDKIEKKRISKGKFAEYFENLKKEYSKNGYCFERGITDYEKFCSYLVKKNDETLMAKKYNKKLDSKNDSIDDFLNLEMNANSCEPDIIRLKKSIMAISKCYKDSGESEKILLLGKLMEETSVGFKRKYDYDFFLGLAVHGFEKMEKNLVYSEADSDLLYYMELMLNNGKPTKRFNDITMIVCQTYALISKAAENDKNKNERKILELSKKIGQVRFNYYKLNGIKCDKKLKSYELFNI